MDPVCLKERNKVSITCYGLYRNLFEIPIELARCSMSKYELFQCRVNHYMESKDDSKKK